MARIPWTKFQDFYLRLGYLKVLVATLSAQRRSSSNDAIVRRLESPLFDSAAAHEELWNKVRARMTWYPKTTSDGKLVRSPEVDEALLVSGECDSILYGITSSTRYKILDWGRDVEFVGNGNQITERGLLLRGLMPADAFGRFLSGDVLSWNPFKLSAEERLFFLYHLADIDLVTLEIIDSLGAWPRETLVETGDAARMTCRALFKVLAKARKSVDLRDVPAFRVAHDLACVIAKELELTDLLGDCSSASGRRAPKPVKPSARRSALVEGKAIGAKHRITKKNADHQTIPRFEQLVDLGFLTKIAADGAIGDAELLAGRRRWRYLPTAACVRWTDAKRAGSVTSDPFQWNGFAAAATAAVHHGQVSERRSVPMLEIGEYLWRAYERVGRPVGHTPFDSVAMLAMILASVEGKAIEMVEFHELVLRLKKESRMPHHLYFASGNTLDKMFVQIKPGFVEKVREVLTDSNTRES